MVTKGSIVLVNFPFTDLSKTKLRPAIVLWVNSTGVDVVVCAITSQNTNRVISGELLLASTDPEFPQTGLRITSKARVTRVVTLDRKLVVRKLGSLGESQHQQLNHSLIQAFQLA